MKNNQFKKIIRTFIDDLCEENNYTAVNVDKTNSTRLTYIYNQSWKIKMTMEIFLNNEMVHISVSKNKEKLVNIANKDDEISVTYMEFGKVLEFIESNF